MQWSDITAPPSPRLLRQFAGLSLVVFGGLALFRAWSGHWDGWTYGLGVLGLGIGGAGAVAPTALRYVYTGWMIVAFPIGFVVSRAMLAILFFLIFTPMALVFRLMGRDALHMKRSQASTYWTPKAPAEDAGQYFKQF